MALKHVPGCVWRSHGSWHWRVKFPGEEKRHDIILTFPFSGMKIPADEPESTAEAAAWRLWEKRMHVSDAGGRPACTMNDLCDAWTAHASTYYRARKGKSGRADTAACEVRMLREMFGSRPVESLTHPDMLRYRDAMIARGLARTTINGRLSILRVMMTWALNEAVVSAQTKAELTQVAPLKPGRTAARETQPVIAVPDDDIEKTCAVMPRTIADMVRMQRLTGMRPDEICSMRWCDIERIGDVWAYKPEHHKCDWRRIPRVVALGPQAQSMLRRLAGANGTDGYVFAPARAVAERYEAARAARVSPMKTDEDARRRAARIADGMVPRKYGERWDVHAYARAISRACAASGVPHWSPNQLRHSCATAVRRKFGIGAARAILGHSPGMRITDRYSFEAAEDEILREASPAALALG